MRKKQTCLQCFRTPFFSPDNPFCRKSGNWAQILHFSSGLISESGEKISIFLIYLKNKSRKFSKNKRKLFSKIFLLEIDQTQTSLMKIGL